MMDHLRKIAIALKNSAVSGDGSSALIHYLDEYPVSVFSACAGEETIATRTWNHQGINLSRTDGFQGLFCGRKTTAQFGEILVCPCVRPIGHATLPHLF
jgi:hypothetical protein